MTYKYNNVYLNNTRTIAGPMESKGPLSKYFDKRYKDYYFEEDTWEKAEIKILTESVRELLKEEQLKDKDIDILISGDLLNQIVASNYMATKFDISYLGIYSACATSMQSLIMGANMIQAGQANRVIVATSSHNNSAEKQFRYPVEYGGPKRETSTFTVTGSASALLSNNKKGYIIESGTIGKAVDSNITDVYDMGGVMAVAAANTIHQHLIDTKRDLNYYDLILTGDLGRYGKDLLKKYYLKEYKEDINNHDDTACMIYDIDKQPVYAGGSGPACLPLVTYAYILKLINSGKYKKVLLVATGALMNTSLVNQKQTIPSIAHAISLEAIK